jgi:hypothetical protein
VDQVVQDVDAVQRAFGKLLDRPLDDLDLAGPRLVAQAGGGAGQAPHLVPGGDQARHEPAADVSGRAGDKASHDHHVPTSSRLDFRP